MRKVLKNTAKTRAYLDSLPKIYLVACWAKYGVMELPFTGKYKKNIFGISVPLVYQYDDFNGFCGHYYLRCITSTTSGRIIMWTETESVADKVAELFNKEMKESWNTKD